VSQIGMDEYAAGETVYRPGDAPTDLFVVAEGSIIETAGSPPWYEVTLGPGAFFGQRALYGGQYTTRAVANEPARLYRLPASLLRAAVERTPRLYDLLLRDALASRLRGIPLVRSLEDQHIRLLASLFEEIDAPAGAPLEMGPSALHIIDYGQITVSGPAALGRSPWRLTSGNFFITPRDNPGPGEPCQVDTATAHLDSRLLRLQVEHLDRLAAGFPDVASCLAAPVDFAPLLAGAGAWQGLTQEHYEHLAQFCGWAFIPVDQNITSQGAPGNTFVIVRSGSAVVSALDERNRLRPKSRLLPGQSYGRTSLETGTVRDATVRAVSGEGEEGGLPVRGAEIVTLDRRDLWFAFRERPELWSDSVELTQAVAPPQPAVKPFPWMRDDESLVWADHPHILWLIVPELFVGGSALLLFLLAALAPDDWRKQAVITLTLLVGLVLIPIALLIAFNYYDDYYALTNRRVTRRDRQFFLYESRTEAPIAMVQDTTVRTVFWGRVFGYGDVIIRTAADVSTVNFLRTPHPEKVRDLVMTERTGALAATQARQREDLRTNLVSALRLTLPVAPRRRALGDGAQLPSGLARVPLLARLRRRPRPVTRSVPSARAGQRLAARVSRPLPDRWRRVLVGEGVPKAMEVPSEFVWRKHWINLLARTAFPLIFMGFLVAAAGFGLPGAFGGIFGFTTATNVLVWGLLGLLGLGWLWWQYVDWSNDLYIVTDDKLVDVEAKPLGLFAKRREGSLERVQTVDSQQLGIFAKIFDYGDVVIRTAAADEGFTFMKVPHPQQVQSIVFQRVNAYRRRAEEKKAADRRNEIVEGLQVYHQLRQSRMGQSPDQW
jgi:CRP-like cAMP-binding protein/membrane protein YdbS with pleckstrin-like domain